MRELKYYVASTIDGFIAREDGSLDCFPMEGEHLAELFAEFPETIPGHLREPLGVSGPNKHFDTVLMGRKTYEVGLDFGVTNPYHTLEQYVVSRSMTESPDAKVTLISGNIVETVRELKGGEGRDIWLCGGGQLAADLFDEIDEIILKLNPIVLGQGTPLFAKSLPTTSFDLVSQKTWSNGFALLTYRRVS